MNRIPCLAFGAVAWLIPACGAFAEPAATSPLGDVTITATRTPVAVNDALARTIVIDRQEIEDSGATDVAGVLRQYAGLEVTRLGGPGQPASLFIRGGNSNYTVVLIDGIRVNDGTSGLAPLADISPEMIDHIEVVEGPRATLYGADAIGGVVNIITRKPGPAQLDLAVAGGRFDTASGAAALRGQGKVGGYGWGANVNVQQQHSAGMPTFAGSDFNSPYRNRTLNGRAQIDFGRVQLEARGWDTHGFDAYQNLDFDPATFAFTGFSPASNTFHNQTLAVEARAKLLASWTSSLTMARSATIARQQQPDGGFAPPGFIETKRPEFDWHNVVTLGPHHRMSFGTRVQNERVSSLSFGTGIHESAAQQYGYVQDELAYGRHHGVVGLSYLHNGAFGYRLNWTVEYGFDLFETTRLIASTGSAFHTPTANDRFGFGGNPDLQPEKALNYEVAVRQLLSPRQNVEVRLFRTDVRDLILVRFDSTISDFVAANVNRAQMEGVQLTWRYASPDWDARVAGVYQNARNRTDHTRLLRRARYTGSASVDRRWRAINIGAGVQAAGDRADVGAIDGLPALDGGYALFDVHVGVRVNRNLKLQVSAENILNHRYETAHGFNQPRSSVFATARYELPL